MTVLQDNNSKPAVEMPKYICEAVLKGDINKSILKWINANRAERANAVTGGDYSIPAIYAAAMGNNLALMSLILQL